MTKCGYAFPDIWPRVCTRKMAHRQVAHGETSPTNDEVSVRAVSFFKRRLCNRSRWWGQEETLAGLSVIPLTSVSSFYKIPMKTGIRWPIHNACEPTSYHNYGTIHPFSVLRPLLGTKNNRARQVSNMTMKKHGNHVLSFWSLANCPQRPPRALWPNCFTSMRLL